MHLPPLTINHKKRLRGRLELGTDFECVRVVPHEAAAEDVVPAVHELVEMAEHIEVSPPPLVPLSDLLAKRDRHPANATAESHGVTVMESDVVALDRQPVVVALLDLELHFRRVAEVTRQVVVSQPFPRMLVAS